RSPSDIAKQMKLARFFIGWDDLSRAGPAVAKVLALVPSDPEAQLLEARLLLMAQPDDSQPRERALVSLNALKDTLPVAKLLLERTRSEIQFQTQRKADGRFPADASMQPVNASNLDLS